MKSHAVGWFPGERNAAASRSAGAELAVRLGELESAVGADLSVRQTVAGTTNQF